MDWSTLLSAKRFGLEHLETAPERNRTEFQRDYDRIIFSAPFRRLQNKTQVFPLPGRIFVHNRLTHSLEVASVGRSLGTNIASALVDARKDIPESIHEIGGIVAAACLVHDLGNPPFGHSGEEAISSYFKDGAGQALINDVRPEEWNDLIRFEGNANAFRLLTNQFKGRREGGYVLTYATLASIVKYPYPSNVRLKKYGFFQSETENYRKIASHLNIVCVDKDKQIFARHPLVYLVEAADDICYQIMDIEDAHKLGILSTERTKTLFLSYFDKARIKRLEETMERVSDPGEQIAYLRASVIGILIDQCTQTFLGNYDAIMDGSFEGSLIKSISEQCALAYKKCSTVAVTEIYNSSEVVEIELAGHKILTTLLDTFIDAVMFPEKSYSKQLLQRIPDQYDVRVNNKYLRVLSVIDFISGMTDIYALDLYRVITGISLPGVDKVN